MQGDLLIMNLQSPNTITSCNSTKSKRYNSTLSSSITTTSSNVSTQKTNTIIPENSNTNIRQHDNLSINNISEDYQPTISRYNQNLSTHSTQPSLYKTELCRSFIMNGVCRYDNKCRFAHGESEVRPIIRHKKYKTELCKNFQKDGVCHYGNRCRFIHSEFDNILYTSIKLLKFSLYLSSDSSESSESSTTTPTFSDVYIPAVPAAAHSPTFSVPITSVTDEPPMLSVTDTNSNLSPSTNPSPISTSTEQIPISPLSVDITQYSKPLPIVISQYPIPLPLDMNQSYSYSPNKKFFLLPEEFPNDLFH